MIYFHCTIDIIETLKGKLQYKSDLWMPVSKKKLQYNKILHYDG